MSRDASSPHPAIVACIAEARDPTLSELKHAARALRFDIASDQVCRRRTMLLAARALTGQR